MFRRIVSTLLIGLAIGSAEAAIDFAPVIEEYTHAGYNYRKVKFKDEKGIVTYLPPQGWSIRGGGNSAQLNPPDKAFVDAVIVATPLRAPQPFDEATVAALEQQVLSTAPAGSQSVQVVRRQESPVAMGSNLSLEIAISYTALGQAFERSVIFVHTPDTQLVFRFSAPKADFAALHQSFRQSIGTWEYKETNPATIADGASRAAGVNGAQLPAPAAN